MEYSVYTRESELIDWTHIVTYDNIDEARAFRDLISPHFVHVKITIK
jgi:hypothetical protein